MADAPPTSPAAPPPLPERPMTITIVCIFAFMATIASVPLLGLDTTWRTLGSWWGAYMATSTVVGLACLLGVWRMRRWGVAAYGLLALNHNLVMVGLGIWSWGALVIPTVVVGVGAVRWRQMI